MGCVGHIENEWRGRGKRRQQQPRPKHAPGLPSTLPCPPRRLRLRPPARAHLVPPRDQVVDVQRQLARLLKAGGVAAVHHLQVEHLVLAAGVARGVRGGGGGWAERWAATPEASAGAAQSLKWRARPRPAQPSQHHAG